MLGCWQTLHKNLSIACRIIDQLWPSVGHFVTHLLSTQVEPLIQKSLEGFSLKDFKFDHVLLGKGQKIKICFNIQRLNHYQELGWAYNSLTLP